MDDWGTPYDSGNLHVFFVCFGLSSGKLQVSYGFFFIGSFTIKGPVFSLMNELLGLLHFHIRKISVRPDKPVIPGQRLFGVY